MSRRSIALLVGLLVLFVMLRVPGLDIPYQQDEFKDVVVSEGELAKASEYFTHPPLTALLFWGSAHVVGGTHMRLVPLFFGLLSAILLYLVVRRRFDERTALTSLFLYTISFSSIWSSLAIGTDGTVLPALFLGAVFLYDRALEEPKRRLWWAALVLVLLTGLMVKLSFILVLGALLLDFIFQNRAAIRVQHLWYGAVALGGALIASVLLFIGVRLLYPSFSFGGMITHALFYVQFSGRQYLQIVVQGIKTVYYLSPLLLVPLLFLSRDMLLRARVFVVYLGLGSLFYFILFDFSRGALDKYLLFMAAPFSVLAGVAITSTFRGVTRTQLFWGIGFGLLGALVVWLCNLLPQTAVPLYPKTEWFGRVLHGEWNVLTPFNGGSGPVGFYISFLTIGVAFGVSFFVALAGRIWRDARPIVVLVVVGIGIAYNAVFLEELVFGKINGSPAAVLEPALSYIATTPQIGSILTYNDIGAYELTKMSRYAGRFYAAPRFEEGHKKLFNEHRGAYLVIGLPPLYEGFYKDYFTRCAILFETSSQAVPATVYSCKPENI